MLGIGTLPSQHSWVAESITWLAQQVGLVNPTVLPGICPAQHNSVVGLYEVLPQHMVLVDDLGATWPLQHMEFITSYAILPQQAEVTPGFKAGSP